MSKLTSKVESLETEKDAMKGDMEHFLGDHARYASERHRYHDHITKISMTILKDLYGYKKVEFISSGS